MAGKEKSRLSEKIDRICKAVFLTEEGKPKSPTLVYSFSLSLLFIAVVIHDDAFVQGLNTRIAHLIDLRAVIHPSAKCASAGYNNGCNNDSCLLLHDNSLVIASLFS